MNTYTATKFLANAPKHTITFKATAGDAFHICRLHIGNKRGHIMAETPTRLDKSEIPAGGDIVTYSAIFSELHG